jgi:tetratricopeptide (TPR) repeat protein
LPRKSTKKQARRRVTFWVTILFVIGALAAGGWLWRHKFTHSDRLNFISISVNHEVRKILSGETLAFHPNDRVKILELSTSIPFNLNVRLSAEGFDVNALRYEELTISDLLPQQEAFDRYQFLVRVKHYNREIGDVTWVIQPYAEDWLDKANRVINSDLRLAVLERAHSLSPEDSRLSRRLLDEYITLKKWEKAAGMLEGMVAKKEAYETLRELLKVYGEMKDTRGIVLILKKLIRLKPGDLEARRALAETFEAAGDWNGAILEHEDLLKRMDEGDRLPVYRSLGYLYTKTGKFEKAISCYLDAAKLDQKDANLHYNLSYLYEKINQKEKANFYLDNAITLKSGDLEGRLKLAQDLLEGGNFKKAGEYLSVVLDKKPDSRKALTLMAKVKEKQGDKKGLKTIYKKILSIDPKDDTVIYNLGALHYEEGSLKDALPYFKKYLKSHPKDMAVHGILFDIYKREENPSAAFEEAIALIELKPKESDIFYFIFDYLKQNGEYERMIPLMQEGLKANPKETALREYLVLAYLKTGKDDQAMAQMEVLLREKPKDIDLLSHLAKLKEKNNDIAGAANAYKQILDISPEHHEASEAYLRLRLRGVGGSNDE